MAKELTLNKCLLRFVAFAVMCSSSFLSAQEKDKPPPTPTPPTPSTQQPQPGSDKKPRMLYISGGVVMADGTALPPSLRVELRCNEVTMQIANVTSVGSFSFDLGQERGQALPDATVSGWSSTWPSEAKGRDRFARPQQLDLMGLGNMELNGCEVRIPPTPGFYSNPIVLKSRSVFENPDVGEILLHRLSESQGTTISILSLSAPPQARRAFEKASKELVKRKPNPDKALTSLARAVEIFPEYAEAWDVIGAVRLALGDVDGARVAFQQSMASDRTYVQPYLNLARLELERQHWNEAEQVTRQLVELNPHIPKSQYFHGLANYHLGRLDTAETSFNSLREQKDFEFYPRTFLYLGMIHALQGEIPTAASELRSYLEIEDRDRVAPELRSELERQLDYWHSQGLIARTGTFSEKK